MIARWCDTIILYGSKEVLGYAGVLNVLIVRTTKARQSNLHDAGTIFCGSQLGLVVNPRRYTRHQQSRIGPV